MADRPTASTVTDAQLDALHADLERAREQLNKMNGRFNWTANEAAEAQTALESCRRQHLAAVDKGIRVEARAERAEQQLAPVRTALAEVLARFRHDTHPGQRCKQTDHVPVETVERWHAVLDETPEPEGGCAHCGGPHAWDDCQAYSAQVTADVAVLDGAQQPSPDGERELRPCGQPSCLPNGAHRYMLGGRIHHCPGANPGPDAAGRVTTGRTNS